ncbi:PD-(D/E)XK motif protein [Microvirga yunnanensis]|uniref:PD-(D/E)XK motif protein n=1 Tax=Microvirga yunnanensis TaxID=2953740 RepID=UPI0021C62881|nr:PD-(D/E)XK motif protein [Microvirga sp. HBU65207]
MKPHNPWADIRKPSTSADLPARRVDPGHPGSFFWARDHEGRCMLLLQYGAGVTANEQRPKLKGIDVRESEGPSGTRRLLLTLKNDHDRDLFEDLCNNIVRATRECADEQAILSTTIQRAWRWHSLLRSGSDRLSEEAQQGLAGELLFLLRLFDHHPVATAIEFWRGPLGEPKDFLIGSTAVEIKTKRGGRNEVTISSEDQLEEVQGQDLVLCISSLSPSSPSGENAFTLSGLVAEVRSRVEAQHNGAIETFETRLSGAGYLDEHDYTDRTWIVLDTIAYHIGTGFPRLVPASVPAGIRNVRYTLDLSACVSFQISPPAFELVVRRAVHE